MLFLRRQTTVPCPLQLRFRLRRPRAVFRRCLEKWIPPTAYPAPMNNCLPMSPTCHVRIKAFDCMLGQNPRSCLEVVALDERGRLRRDTQLQHKDNMAPNSLESSGLAELLKILLARPPEVCPQSSTASLPTHLRTSSLITNQTP